LRLVITLATSLAIAPLFGAYAKDLAVIDGRKFTSSYVYETIGAVNKRARADFDKSPVALREQILSQAAERMTIATAAIRVGLDKNPDLHEKLSKIKGEAERDKELQLAWLGTLITHFMSDEAKDVEAFYDNIAKAPRYRLRFMYFTDQAKAMDAQKSIRNMKDFDQAMAKRSHDRMRFQNETVFQYQHKPTDDQPPTIEILPEMSTWGWKLQGVTLDDAKVGDIANIVCEGQLCAFSIVTAIDDSPAPAFTSLASDKQAVLREARAFMGTRAIETMTLREAEINWVNPPPFYWANLLARPALMGK